MVSIFDVANKAGVSIATVSNVLNNSKPVSDELRRKVEKAVEELGYKANPMARGLKSGKTGNIGIVLPKITALFFPHVLEGAEAAAKKLGFKITYCSSGYDIATEREYMEVLKATCVDGIILDSCCDGENEPGYIKYLASLDYSGKKIPVVSLERALAPGLINSVAIDERLHSCRAVQHLTGSGRKRIIYISGPKQLSMISNQFEGYMDALTGAGIEFDPGLVFAGDYTPLSGFNSINKALDDGVGFDAVFAANDQTAVGAVMALKNRGCKIPEDVAVVGFDNIFVSALTEPSITTVDVPKYAMGYAAMELLDKHLGDPAHKPEDIVLDCDLIIRRSSDQEGGDNWDFLDW